MDRSRLALLSLWQSLRVGFRMAITEMLSNKLRSFLSVAGVLFGVAAMMSMLTLLKGVEGFMDQMLNKWIGMVWIWKVDSPPEGMQRAFSRSPGLRLSDGLYLSDSVPEVKEVYRSVERQVETKNFGRITKAALKGVTPSTFTYDLEGFVVSEGRNFDSLEYESGRQVCILSYLLAQRLRLSLGLREGRDELVGRNLVLGGIQLKIVGVFYPEDEKKEPWGMRRRVFTPLKTLQKFYTGFNPDPGALLLKVKDHRKLDQQVNAVARSLTSLHRGAEDFEYGKAEEASEAAGMIRNISLVMGVIAALSLLIGGLGIMNVMLSSVTERIREIGVRKALGAGRTHILVQFLAESTALSLAGGALGLPLGCLPLILKDSIEKAVGFAPTLSLSSILAILATLVVIGIGFGLYPALKAVKLNPADALRYE